MLAASYPGAQSDANMFRYWYIRADRPKNPLMIQNGPLALESA
jgi:hypothetical protein